MKSKNRSVADSKRNRHGRDGRDTGAVLVLPPNLRFRPLRCSFPPPRQSHIRKKKETTRRSRAHEDRDEPAALDGPPHREAVSAAGAAPKDRVRRGGGAVVRGGSRALRAGRAETEGPGAGG